MILVVLFVTACGGLLRLGLWQLDRAEQKLERFAAYRDARSARALDFAALDAGAAPTDYHWRRTHAHGRYTDFHVLLDNRSQAGRAGYEVLTAFTVDNHQTVLVNRGWVGIGASRKALPAVTLADEDVTVAGYLGDVPVVGVALNDAAAGAEWLAPNLLRVQRVDLNAIAGLSGRALWPAVIYLDADAAGALSVAWPEPGSGADKHKAYAVQWFAMAAVLAAIGVWNWRKAGTHG